MTMFKNAENLLTSLRDAIFKLPTNNSIIIGYEHVPISASSTVYVLRPPANAKKAVMILEDSGMPSADPTVNATPAYPQSLVYTSKILLGRYTVANHVPIPIKDIAVSGTTLTITPVINNPSSGRTYPYFGSSATNFTITGNSNSALNGNYSAIITNTSNSVFVFTQTGFTNGTYTGGSFIYTPIVTSGIYSTASTREGMPMYRGEYITIEGYNNLINFQFVTNSTGTAIGLKVLYYS